MRESGFSRPAMAPSRIVEHAPPSGPPIFAADPATAPLPDPVARPAWLWTPYWWDPDELRVTTRRAGVRQAPQQLTRRSRPALAWVFRPTRPRLGRRSGRRVLAAT